MEHKINIFLQAQTPQTRRSYEWFLSRLFTWLQETKTNPVSLDANDLNIFFEDQQTWGESTRRLGTCAVRAFYRWWQGNEHPILKTSLHRAKTAPQRVLSTKQAIRLLSSIDPNTTAGTRDLAMVMLMLDTGLRESEIARLEIKRLNMDERKLNVIVKGGEWGKAVFSQPTADQMERWLAERRDLRGRIHSLPPTVFVSLKTGKALTPSGIRKLFERLSDRAGITVSPHDLRRTFATLATKAGAPTRVLMAGGRWENIEQLESYTRSIDATDFEPWFPVKYLEGKAL